jgi:hypothetical protein
MSVNLKSLEYNRDIYSFGNATFLPEKKNLIQRQDDQIVSVKLASERNALSISEAMVW